MILIPATGTCDNCKARSVSTLHLVDFGAGNSTYLPSQFINSRSESRVGQKEYKNIDINIWPGEVISEIENVLNLQQHRTKPPHFSSASQERLSAEMFWHPTQRSNVRV